MAGAVLGEICKDSRSAKCCIFQNKMFVLSAESNLGCGLRTDGVMLGSVSDHARIGRALEMTFQDLAFSVWSTLHMSSSCLHDVFVFI